MRRRGVVFKSFKDITKDDNGLTAIAKMNENLKLVLELLADLRVNTSDDPKEIGEERKPSKNHTERK